MSENSTNDLDLNLHFLPEWAKQGSSKQIYDKYTGNEEVERPRSPRRNDGDRRPSRPSGTGRPPSSGAVVVAVAIVNVSGVGTVDRTGTEVVLLRGGDVKAGDKETHHSHPEVRDRRVVTLSRCRTSMCR
ncbi:MAG: hypothetical protein LR011_03575 [Verrucomicrobia bacterium]|nr:hypothetical protein [Verrucomicrobiota bacterium]